MDETKFVVIGAGPAGLTAAYEVARLGGKPIVLEKDGITGGLSRTETYKGFSFDMGGHRFFTKAEEVSKIWWEVLANDFLRRPRLSRIFYKQTFFYYPLKVFDALKGLGLTEAVLIMLSYLRWKLFPYPVEDTFEQWVTNRFGKRLFKTFFETYTEKVWGIPCTELKAEWAAQRIKDLSVKTLLVSLFLKPKNKIKTLIEEFDYPRLGPGMMWRAVRDKIEEKGGQVRLNSDVTRIRHDGSVVHSVTVGQAAGEETIPGTHFITSMPLTEFIRKLDPPPPQRVLDAAARLHYRDFLTVCLIINQKELFPDNWIYVHEPGVQVARIQNFKNWSPEMVPDQSKTSLGLEYFCNEGDAVWTMADADLVDLGKREIEKIGLARAQDVEDGCVFRVPKAYPVYDSGYAEHLAVLRQTMDGFVNCLPVGRNGLHRYNNQDHSMLTGLYAVRNLLQGERNDLWTVNAEMDYHEEVSEKAAARPRSTDELLVRALRVLLAKIDPVAMGVAVGSVVGSVLLAMTLILFLRGGDHIGPNLGLLAYYLPGYRVTPGGALLGFGYGMLGGFVAGWSFAQIRNGSLWAYVAFLQWRARRAALRKLLDEI